ncbi:hypothetical protein, partial [Mesotoga sp. Brook.08.YT.4.2.5.1]|uniref:hypothetical protein n=1 Tax=Mesotoga sp. Brook.08.YT.4.2.5.1 TaxID=1421001 RepID=UPI001CA507BA
LDPTVLKIGGAWRVVNNRQSPPAPVSLHDASTTPSRKQTGEGEAFTGRSFALLNQKQSS